MGHVRHGKSTLAGRILYELGLVSERTMKEFRTQAEAVAKLKRLKVSPYAWILDKGKEERLTGHTIEPSYAKFNADRRRVVIVDVPGHPAYKKNVILGISEADAGVLVVDAAQGIQNGTREHALFARAFGIEQLVVAVNKMDASVIGYGKEPYDELSCTLSSMLESMGFGPGTTHIPMSSIEGDNITRPSSKMPWYKGPTLLTVLTKIRAPRRTVALPFRMPVDQVFAKKTVGTIAAGKVATGEVHRGDIVAIQPQGLTATVRSIEEFHIPISAASAGDDVGILLGGVSPTSLERGSVLADPNKPLPITKQILARVRVLDGAPTMRVGYTPKLYVHSCDCTATFSSLVSTIDPDTGEIRQREPNELQPGDVAYVEIELSKAIVMDEGNRFPRLARFALLDRDKCVGIGVCIEVIG